MKLAGAVLAVALVACGGDARDASSSSDAAVPTFFDVQLLWNGGGCTEGGCHNPTDHKGGLDLVSDPIAALVGVDATSCAGRKRVVAGAPDRSFLVDKLRGRRLCGKRMPYGCDESSPSFCLDEARVRLVEDWIRAGARGE